MSPDLHMTQGQSYHLEAVLDDIALDPSWQVIADISRV